MGIGGVWYGGVGCGGVGCSGVMSGEVVWCVVVWYVRVLSCDVWFCVFCVMLCVLCDVEYDGVGFGGLIRVASSQGKVKEKINFSRSVKSQGIP